MSNSFAWDPVFKTHLCRVENTELGLKWDYFALFVTPHFRDCLVCSFEDVCEGLEAIVLNGKKTTMQLLYSVLQSVR